MRLYDVIAAAQGGRCFHNFGRRLQIDEASAGVVVWHLIRALRPCIESWLAQPGGGYVLLACLNRDGFDRLLAETASFSDGGIRNRGYRLVSEWVASAPLDIAEFDMAAAASGLPREPLARALPWIAALEMGALQRLADKPLRVTLARLRGPRYAEHVTSPSAALLEELSRADQDAPAGGIGRTFDTLFERLTGPMPPGQTART